MYFCIKCENFSSTDRCGFCGAKKIREAQENDPVYLTEIKNYSYAGMLQEALKQNGIPYIKKEKHGGILKFVGFGFGMEEFKFFVPLGAIAKAKEILEEMFKPVVLRLAFNTRFKKQKLQRKQSRNKCK